MPNIKKATILITNSCNFNCQHCFWGNIETKKIITDYRLEQIIKLCVINNLKHICFSGGEPILYLEKIIKAISPFKSSFDKVSICTNGYWGQNAKHICGLLKESNIATIELSYDFYHAQYVTEDCIRNIVIESKKAGINVLCVVAVSNQKEMLKFYMRLSKFIDRKNLIFQYIGPYGRGKNISNNYFNKSAITCKQFMANICIDFDGLLYYCCGPHIVGQKESIFCVGEFNQKNINRIKEDLKLFGCMRQPFEGVDYLCEMCFKRLDNYILSKESVRMQNK